MKCPDCGSRLSDIQLGGQFLFRCYRCGGFWGDALSFSKIDSHALVSLRRVKIDPLWLKGGKGICPQDGLPLQQYFGDDVAMNIQVRSCIRCGKRWYSGDSLFEQKMAHGDQVIKPSLAPRILFLSIASLVFVGVLAGSVQLVQQRQKTAVRGGESVHYFVATYLGEGREEVVFESMIDISVLEYRELGAAQWVNAAVSGVAKQTYSSLLTVQKERQYEVRILGQIYTFIAR